MYKLIRFYNQNRKKIFKIILIIVFIIGIIQLLNFFVKEKLTANNIKNNNTINSNLNNESVSNKSIISGSKISESKLQKDNEIIKNFINYCNEKDIDSAYNLLTEDCKEIMFPSLDDFYNIYYLKTFNNEYRTYTLENWIGDTYQVRYTEDVLSTGNINGSETKQDYITLVRENEDYKLNINYFIGKHDTTKTTEHKDIKVTIKSIETYMDYEIYNLSIQNNSKNTILLDTSDDVNSIYLEDDKNMKYYFYNSEIVENRLLIKSGFTNNLQIKFNNTYTSDRKISNLVFSKLILNYDEYKNMENKNEYDFYRYVVNN